MKNVIQLISEKSYKNFQGKIKSLMDCFSILILSICAIVKLLFFYSYQIFNTSTEAYLGPRKTSMIKLFFEYS